MKKLIKITLSIFAIALILTLPALADGMRLEAVMGIPFVPADSELLTDAEFLQQLDYEENTYILRGDHSKYGTNIKTTKVVSDFTLPAAPLPFDSIYSKYILIDDEIILVLQTTYWGFNNVRRGCLGTAKAEHSDGAEIRRLLCWNGMLKPRTFSELYYKLADEPVCKTGREFNVTVALDGNVGLTHLELETACPDGMELVSVTSGDVTYPMEMTEAADGSIHKVTFTSDTAVTANGSLAFFTFKVGKNATVGDTAIVIKVTDAKDGNRASLDFPDMTVSAEIVKDNPKGDINGNGKAELKDVTLLRRYIAGGYGVEVDEYYADVNCDGKADLEDVTYLRRALAGYDGFTLE